MNPSLNSKFLEFSTNFLIFCFVLDNYHYIQLNYILALLEQQDIYHYGLAYYFFHLCNQSVNGNGTQFLNIVCLSLLSDSLAAAYAPY